MKSALIGLSGTILALVGLVLIGTKLFGFPYLFEGITFLFMGIIVVLIISLAELYHNTLDVLTNLFNTLTPLQKKQTVDKPQTMSFVITPDTSPEELRKIKEQFPFLKDIVDANVITEKVLEELTLEELEIRLQKAIDKDAFEEAAHIQQIILKKS